MKNILKTILALTLVLSLSTIALANEQKVSEFSDVPADHWAYTSIMAMTEKGLFSGTSTPVNGVGTFSPDKTMSRAEFVTVVVRALYKDELTALPAVSKGTPWYSNAYSLAIDKGLLNKSELNGGDLSQPMTRQEMAMVLVRAAEKNGETPSQLIDTGRIADYSTVGTAYKDYVVKAYSMGMLCGTDNKGTYAPLNSLNRGAASMVLYRLVEPSSRQEVDFSAPTTPTTPETPQGQSQKWVEGEQHYGNPKVGDIVVKNGKEITLKLGYGNVLGAGQGIDLYSGLVLKTGAVVGDGTSWLDGRTLRKDPISGEMHTGQMWSAIANSDDVYPVGLVGDYDGEAYGLWYKWNSNLNKWDWYGPDFS